MHSYLGLHRFLSLRAELCKIFCLFGVEQCKRLDNRLGNRLGLFLKFHPLRGVAGFHSVPTSQAHQPTFGLP